MPLPTTKVQCQNCQTWNTMTHYFHVNAAGVPHDFEQPSDPAALLTGPVDQSCPIDGCFTEYPNPNPPPAYRGNPVFTLCLDCGNIQ